MLDEARTRLYYTIRSIQDYIQNNDINETGIQLLPENLQQLLKADKQILVEAYHNTDYTIVQQVIDTKFDVNYVLDMLEWIKLGHYQLSANDVKRLIGFYNKNVEDHQRITEIKSNKSKLQNVRMTEYLTHIKDGVLNEHPDLLTIGMRT